LDYRGNLNLKEFLTKPHVKKCRLDTVWDISSLIKFIIEIRAHKRFAPLATVKYHKKLLFDQYFGCGNLENLYLSPKLGRVCNESNFM
jgi:hypothetical protein